MNGGQRTVAVAFSGGRDSLALLHATARSAATLGLQVVALHVHHGLLPEADAWVRSAQQLCARWRRRGWPVRLRWQRLPHGPAPGDSVEAWARRERYAALRAMALEEGASVVLLGQHRRDQAETLLLQALRGGGPRALAAMPRGAEREGIQWLRPWLSQPRSAIDAYIRRYRLRPIEDPSNTDSRWARNRLRNDVWPVLSSAFPDAEQALAAAADRAAEAAAALAELAAMDLANVLRDGALVREPWMQLSVSRRALVLRHWLGPQLPTGVPDTLVQRLLAEWPGASAATWPVDETRHLHAYRGRLGWLPRSPLLENGPLESATIDLSVEGVHGVPLWGGCFEVQRDPGGAGDGIPAQHLRQAMLRPREGGEQFQRAPRTPPRSLKKQYQLAGIAAPGRQGPLVWSSAGQLLYVPGLGLDARARAEPGEPRLTLHWILLRRS